MAMRVVMTLLVCQKSYNVFIVMPWRHSIKETGITHNSNSLYPCLAQQHLYRSPYKVSWHLFSVSVLSSPLCISWLLGLKIWCLCWRRVAALGFESPQISPTFPRLNTETHCSYWPKHPSNILRSKCKYAFRDFLYKVRLRSTLVLAREFVCVWSVLLINCDCWIVGVITGNVE